MIVREAINFIDMFKTLDQSVLRVQDCNLQVHLGLFWIIMDRQKTALKKNNKIMDPWILQLRTLYILAHINAIMIRMVD